VPGALSAAARVRQFNRFYTQRLGLLNAGLLESPFSLAEVRVLYEIAHHPAPTASVIAHSLQIDAGYLSRLLRGLRRRGLVSARTDPDDRRGRRLALTARGKKAFAVLNARASREIAGLLKGLSGVEQETVLASLSRVENLLGGTKSQAGPEIALRGPEPGDLGWVVQRHGELYREEYGWNAEFERLVAQVVGEFAAAEPESGHRCWIATLDGKRAGCIFLMPASATVAKLRLLLVEPWARGHGLGGRLIQASVAAARDGGYRTLTLWTNDVLKEARRLYQRAGFELMTSERHRSFGKSLVGQTWELAL
jgi:DNA-binding MarR family transcriptional regulator/N-acetylglutamate synthase-like GNAT family acetyltransferase